MLRLSPSPDRLPQPAPLDAAEAGSSLGRDAWRRLRKNKLAVASGLFLLLLVAAVLILPGLLGLSYSEQIYGQFQPPSLRAHHWFGTDLLGHDVFARVLFGCRISLAVALAATVVSLVIGVSWGAIAGYSGG